jgi:hypothetical protein
LFVGFVDSGLGPKGGGKDAGLRYAHEDRSGNTCVPLPGHTRLERIARFPTTERPEMCPNFR